MSETATILLQASTVAALLVVLFFMAYYSRFRFEESPEGVNQMVTAASVSLLAAGYIVFRILEWGHGAWILVVAWQAVAGVFIWKILRLRKLSRASTETKKPGKKENMKNKATQVEHPWRATVRTLFQALVALAAASPFVYEAFTGNSAEAATGGIATFLAVSLGVTRVMALPQVEEFLEKFLPFLAAAPKLEEEQPE